MQIFKTVTFFIKTRRTLIWKFYKNNSDVTHYIMGTMHMATLEAFTYVEMAQKYIDKSSIYIAEMDLMSVDPQEVMDSCLLPDSKNLSDWFRPKVFKKIQRSLNQSFNVDLNRYSKFTPFYINNILTDNAMAKSYPMALDHHLWYYAVEAQKEMYGIESFADQKEIMLKIPIELQVKALKSCAKNPALFRKKVKHLNSLYRDGNMSQLYKSTQKNMGALRHLMIYDRNDIMTQRLLRLLDDHQAFIAVGAAHLPGKYGMLRGLKMAGYTIQLLKN